MASIQLKRLQDLAKFDKELQSALSRLQDNIQAALNSLSTFTPPNLQIFTAGTGNYVIPSPAPLYLEIEAVGGGGGGAAGGNSGFDGTAGGNTTFGTFITAGGGLGGKTNSDVPSTSGTSGGPGIPIVNAPAVQIMALQGGAGQGITQYGGQGGASALGGNGGGRGGTNAGAASYTGAPNSGGGGGGGGAYGNTFPGGGGGSGAYVRALILNPISGTVYPFSVGAKGNHGSNGTASGSDGGSGILIVWARYQ